MIGDGPGTESFRPTPDFPIPPYEKSTHRAVIEVTIGESKTSQVTGRIDGGSPVSATFQTPLAIDNVTLQCGIVYADNSDQGVVTSEVADVSLIACP